MDPSFARQRTDLGTQGDPGAREALSVGDAAFRGERAAAIVYQQHEVNGHSSHRPSLAIAHLHDERIQWRAHPGLLFVSAHDFDASRRTLTGQGEVVVTAREDQRKSGDHEGRELKDVHHPSLRGFEYQAHDDAIQVRGGSLFPPTRRIKGLAHT